MKLAIALGSFLLLGTLTLAAQVARGPAQAPKGSLLIVGGGGTTDAIIDRAIALMGGKDKRMLVVPQASKAEDAGVSSRDFWKEKGVANITILDLSDEKKALAEIEKADFIWMPGGDQAVLMDLVAKTAIPAAIQARYKAGALVGGTSAGAAVMSRVMLIGGDKADLKNVRGGGSQTSDGLGLWGDAIVDQHFFQRQRFNRLLACVLDHPELVGVGIDEKTAVVVTGDHCEVLGESSVLVLDARRAHRREPSAGTLHSADDVRLAIYRAGDSFDLTLREPR